MVLHQSQKIIASDLTRFRVLCCGRRWGKTTLAIDQMKGRAAIPNSRVAYIAPTFQQARDIAWEQLKRDCRDAAESINESRLEIKLVNKSIIILRGWEAIETLRGQMFDLIVLDEVASMRNFWMYWQEVIRPTLTDTKGEGLFISTPKGFNHFYELYQLEPQDKDFKSFHFTSYENPHIPSEEINKAKLELTEDRFAQEYLADFRKTEGLVYKEFQREIHLFGDEQEKFIIPVAKFAGVDFGFTNPAAIITIKEDFDKKYWITNEYYKTGKTDSEVAELVAGSGFAEVYPDPENPAAIEELKRRGVYIKEVVKGKDSVKNGISKIRDLFKQNRIKIHSRCVNLIMELETYSYPEKKDMHNEDELPIKESDHLLDALRYALSMREDRPRSREAPVFIPTQVHYGMPPSSKLK